MGYRRQDTGYRLQDYIITRRTEPTGGNSYVMKATLGPNMKIIEILCRIAVSRGNIPNAEPLLSAVNRCSAISVEICSIERNQFQEIRGTKTRQNGSFSQLAILAVKGTGALSREVDECCTYDTHSPPGLNFSVVFSKPREGGTHSSEASSYELSLIHI